MDEGEAREHEHGRAQRPCGRRPQQDLEECEAQGQSQGLEALRPLSDAHPARSGGALPADGAVARALRGRTPSATPGLARTTPAVRAAARGRRRGGRGRRGSARVGNASQAAAASASEGGTSSSCERSGPVTRTSRPPVRSAVGCGEHAEATALPRRQGSEASQADLHAGHDGQERRGDGRERTRAHAWAAPRDSSVQDDDLVAGGDPLVVGRPALLVRDVAHHRHRAARGKRGDDGSRRGSDHLVRHLTAVRRPAGNRRCRRSSSSCPPLPRWSRSSAAGRAWCRSRSRPSPPPRPSSPRSSRSARRRRRRRSGRLPRRLPRPRRPRRGGPPRPLLPHRRPPPRRPVTGAFVADDCAAR